MNKENKFSVKKLTSAALLTAVTIVLAQISVMTPWGVPFTLQTFAIALCGYVLGARMGFTSVMTYIIMGAAGVPVFSNFRGGLSIIFGLTGGFIFGFIPFVLLCGLAVKRKSAVSSILLGVAGLVICHILGVLQFSFITSSNITQSLILVSLPYLIKDFVSVFSAYYLSVALRRTIPKVL
jgi:biotin transport system substrate-specific component